MGSTTTSFPLEESGRTLWLDTTWKAGIVPGREKDGKWEKQAPSSIGRCQCLRWPLSMGSILHLFVTGFLLASRQRPWLDATHE